MEVLLCQSAMYFSFVNVCPTAMFVLCLICERIDEDVHHLMNFIVFCLKSNSIILRNFGEFQAVTKPKPVQCHNVSFNRCLITSIAHDTSIKVRIHTIERSIEWCFICSIISKHWNSVASHIYETGVVLWLWHANI